MKTNTLFHVGVFLVALLIAAGGMKVGARDNSTSAPLLRTDIARVDMQRVYEASDAPSVVAQKYQDAMLKAADQSRLVRQVGLLTPDELGEFLHLITLDNPTPAQQARIQELKKLADQRSAQLTSLSTKPDKLLTADDKATIQQLQSRLQQFQQDVLPNVDKQLSDNAMAQVDQCRKEQMEQLRKIVEDVAKKRGIHEVWSADTLVYSDNDITDDVIHALHKKS